MLIIQLLEEPSKVDCTCDDNHNNYTLIFSRWWSSDQPVCTLYTDDYWLAVPPTAEGCPEEAKQRRARDGVKRHS